MNQKHILPYPRFLVSASSLPRSFSLLPASLLLTSPLLPHLILHSLHNQSSGELEVRGQN